MTDLVIPRLNSNDESYVLVEWLVPAAAAVAAGDAVAVIETSKASSELTSAAAGFLVPLVAASATCRPGEVIARIAADPETAAAPAAAPADPPPPASGVVLTRSAQELAERHAIPMAAIIALGRRVVKESDLRDLVGPAPSRGVELSAHQRAVARAVIRSHETIPSAFTVTKVSATELLAARERLGEQHSAFVGIPEMVVYVAARLWQQHPACFATVHDDLRVEPATGADIGVTVDVGTGLFVPVIRAADTIGVTTVAQRLMLLRARALRRTMRDADIGGARLTVSLQNEPGIVLARPIVFPGQTCSLSLCALQEELVLGADGMPARHEYFHLGLAYDHRIVNGREAMAFLGAIRAGLESGEVR